MNNLNNNLNDTFDIKDAIAQNIAKYRKALGLTQAELAEKLNYSDKTLSKWERGDSIPDIVTLKQLADLFGITVDLLISDDPSRIEFNPLPKKKGKNKKKAVPISLLSVGIVWLIAILAFVALKMQSTDIENALFKPWYIFIYAIPASSIVLLVFSGIWGNNSHVFLNTSVLLWTLTLAVFLTFQTFRNAYLLFIIPIPLQIMAFIFFIILKENKQK